MAYKMEKSLKTILNMPFPLSLAKHPFSWSTSPGWSVTQVVSHMEEQLEQISMTKFNRRYEALSLLVFNQTNL